MWVFHRIDLKCLLTLVIIKENITPIKNSPLQYCELDRFVAENKKRRGIIN